MSRALVTGANGAIGRKTVEWLRTNGWKVAGLGHGPSSWLAPGGIDYWIAGDISTENLNVVSSHFGAPDLVINLAGGSSVGPSLEIPLGDFERTVTASVRILNWIWKSAPTAKLVAVSSAAVYGDCHEHPIDETAPPSPLSPYGHHKWMMEETVKFWGRTFDISAVIVRPFSVYGPGLQKQLVFDLCTRLSEAPEELVLSGTGEETRDWIMIDDMARLLVQVAARATPDVPIFNGCTGKAHTVAHVARALAEAWGHGTKIMFNGQSRTGDPKHLVGSTTRLRASAFSPSVALEEGLTRVVAAATQNALKGNMR